jgi:hypothetical protein
MNLEAANQSATKMHKRRKGIESPSRETIHLMVVSQTEPRGLFCPAVFILSFLCLLVANQFQHSA